jgi:hypothetical protein
MLTRVMLIPFFSRRTGSAVLAVFKTRILLLQNKLKPKNFDKMEMGRIFGDGDGDWLVLAVDSDQQVCQEFDLLSALTGTCQFFSRFVTLFMQCQSIVLHRLVKMLKIMLPFYNRTAPETVLYALDEEWTAAAHRLGYLTQGSLEKVFGADDHLLRGLDSCRGQSIPSFFCRLVCTMNAVSHWTLFGRLEKLNLP